MKTNCVYDNIVISKTKFRKIQFLVVFKGRFFAARVLKLLQYFLIDYVDLLE